MSRRACPSCGSLASETTFAEGADRCMDCLAEVRSSAARHARKPVITRRSYRAALRHRAKSAQLDLVDMIVRCP
nr:hypothetical protein [uncultured Rhodopila sp.]